MEKIKKSILLYTSIYLVVYVALYFILKTFNLTFLVWVKNISILIISIGTIAGFIQIAINIDKDKKFRKILLYIFIIFLTFIIFLINAFYFLFIANMEEQTTYEGFNMIKETRQVLKSNYIKYYDYMNPFVRSMQERVYVMYDDTISEDEYGGTSYYNKEGKEVEDINGTEFIDLSNLKKYASNGNATYENVQELIQELYHNYGGNIYKVHTSDNYLFIYLTEVPEKLVTEESKMQELKDIVQNFLTVEASKKNSYYDIRFWNGYIAICNKTYVDY